MTGELLIREVLERTDSDLIDILSRIFLEGLRNTTTKSLWFLPKLPSEHLAKSSTNILAAILNRFIIIIIKHTFIISLSHQYFPTLWRQAEIIHIFQKVTVRLLAITDRYPFLIIFRSYLNLDLKGF